MQSVNYGKAMTTPQRLISRCWFYRPRLNEELSHVSSLQAEDVVLLDVVTSLARQRVMKVNHVGAVS